ncbi:MAG: hypothetical protein ACLQFR_29920 [Streptosporangiaceae bacterium]
MTPGPPHPPPVFSGDLPRPPRVPALDWVVRNRHFTAPPLILPAVLLAGFILAWRRVTEATVIASAVTVVLFWAGAHLKWDRPAEQWYARLSVLALGGWLSAAAFTGVSWLMLYIAAGLIAVWGGFWFWHKRPRAKRGDAALTAEWDAWWGAHAASWGLHGSRVTGVLSKSGMETVDIALWKGRQHIGHVRDVMHLIASGLGGYVRPGNVRVDEHPDDPSHVLLRLKRADPLRHPRSWHLGLAIQSVTEKAAIGFTELGEDILVSLLSNWFVIGRSRSGKSNELSNFLAAITGCDDALVWLVDRKGGRAARPWMAAMDWCAVELDEIRVMFGVVLAEIKARARDAYTGEEQITPTMECPAIFLCIDETYEVTGPAGEARLATLLASITSQGMGVAVYVVVLTQYGALEESVRTEQTRSNLISRLLFHVTDARHGAFAIPEYDKLDASKLRQQGAFLMKLGPDAAPAPGRGFEFGHPLAREVARRNGAMPHRRLMLYASEHQGVYDTRWSRLPQPFWRDAPQTQGLAFAGPSSPIPLRTETPVDHSPEVLAMAAQIEEEVGDGPVIREPAITMPSDADLRSAFERNRARLARALQSAPPEGISPKQLTMATGLSRSWVMATLKALTERNALLKPGEGLYLAAPGTDIWDEMEAIRQANSRLLEDARSA